MTPGIRNMLIEGESDRKIKAKAVSEGMETLKMQGLSLAMSGVTTMDELFRVVDMGGG
jgi:type II secretory ATPase GspE/PulE/Tfp pilus assembly ATPase PilB-like protein